MKRTIDVNFETALPKLRKEKEKRKLLSGKYYTIIEISKLMGLSIKTIRKYIAEGRIRGKKVANIWYAKESEVKLYITARKTKVSDVKSGTLDSFFEQ